jgi:hypothetical protein
VLGRASYVSQLQTAGALFSRDNALEGVRRLRLLGQAGYPAGHIEWRPRKRPEQARTFLPMRSVGVLCSDAALDYVIVAGSWAQAQHRYRSGNKQLSLIACEAFR